MSPPKENKEYMMYFDCNFERNKVQCKVCHENLGNYCGNLKRHLISKHPNISKKLKVGFKRRHIVYSRRKRHYIDIPEIDVSGFEDLRVFDSSIENDQNAVKMEISVNPSTVQDIQNCENENDERQWEMKSSSDEINESFSEEDVTDFDYKPNQQKNPNWCRKRRSSKKMSRKYDMNVKLEAIQYNDEIDSNSRTYQTRKKSFLRSFNLQENPIPMPNLSDVTITQMPQNSTSMVLEKLPNQKARTKTQSDVPLPIFEQFVNIPDFIKKCIHIIAISRASLSLFDSPVFSSLLRKPAGLKMSKELVNKYINTAADIMSYIIKEDLKTKIVSIKYEIVTKYGKVILIIKTRYFCDKSGQIVVKTLGGLVIDSLLAKEICDNFYCILTKYEINLESIYSLNLDSGNNFISQSKSCKSFLETQIENIDLNKHFMMKESQLSELIEKKIEMHDVLASVADGALKELNIENYLILIQNFVKIQNVNNNENKTDCYVVDTSSWTNVYQIVRTINENTAFEKFLNNLDTNEQHWKFGIDFMEAFLPLFKIAVESEKENKAKSDFLVLWLECKMILTEMIAVNAIASIVLRHLGVQTSILFQNEEFRSAVYLDPRFNFNGSTLLSEENKTAAIAHLSKTYDKVQSNVPHSSPIEEQIPVIKSKLDLFIEMEAAVTSTESKIEDKLFNLQFREKLTITEDVFSYWLKQSDDNKILIPLAKVVLAAPSSRFSYIGSTQCMELALSNLHPDQNLNNLIIINQNQELLKILEFDIK